MPASDQLPAAPLEVSVEEARALLATRPEDSLLVDIREPFEFELARIAGAEPIPMRQVPEHLHSPRLPEEKHLLIHCHHGGRSLRVTEYLRAHGYPRVSNVAGGIQAWSEQIDSSIPTY